MPLLKKFSVRFMTLSLLAAAFSFTSLHAQTVAYVTNSGSNTVSVIDIATNTVTGTIPVGHVPEGVVFAPDNAHAFVTNFNDGTVSVIDTGASTVVATINLARPGDISQPTLPAITPDGKSLYVPDLAKSSVVVVDLTTNTVTARVPVGSEPVDAAITPDGTHVYVANSGDGTVAVINTTTNTVVTSIQVAPGQGELFTVAVTPDGAHVYAGGGGNSIVGVIATATNSLVTIPNVPNATGVAVNPDGATVYVTDGGHGVSVIDTATNAVQPDLITVGNGALFVTVTPDGSFAYVDNLSDGTVSVIKTSTNTVVATVPVGSQPQGIAIANLSTSLAAFSVEDLDIGEHEVKVRGDFTLGASSGGLDLAHQPLSLSVGSLSIIIPANSFRQVGGQHHFVFHGNINGLHVDFHLQAEHGSSTSFDYFARIRTIDLDAANPVTVTLKIGENSGTTTVNTCVDCDTDD